MKKFILAALVCFVFTANSMADAPAIIEVTTTSRLVSSSSN
jgi:hypothetical protein